MCEICRRIPCDPRCPNALEPKAVATCVECGYEIYSGDKYFEGADGCICEDCMTEMPLSKLLAMFGETLRTA